MIRFQNVAAIFRKQILDTLKNMQILILFFIYPLVTFVMLNALGEQAGMKSFFVATFAAMHGVFTPIVCTAAVLSEEKEKNTLRMLILSGVKPAEYLFSIGFYVILAVVITGCSFLFMGGYDGAEGSCFLILLFAGALVSVLLGTCIGIMAPNAAAANAMAVPVSMVFAFLPMLAFFNPAIEKIARYTYSYQISSAIQKIGGQDLGLSMPLLTAGIYLAVFILAFSLLFHKKKWE